jgi:hypothetical protein
VNSLVKIRTAKITNAKDPKASETNSPTARLSLTGSPHAVAEAFRVAQAHTVSTEVTSRESKLTQQLLDRTTLCCAQRDLTAEICIKAGAGLVQAGSSETR